MVASVQSITILGATGSIGVNTLRVIADHPNQFKDFALTANSNIDLLFAQCVQFVPEYAVLGNEHSAERLSSQLKAAKISTEVVHGAQALAMVASASQVNTVMAAIVGGAGLLPTLAAATASTEKP